MKIGRVYKIISSQGNECYVGSTFNTLRDRFRKHKEAIKHGNGSSVEEIFTKYGTDKCRCILIKEYEVIDRNHLEVYETLWIKKLKAINKIEPSGGLLKRQYQRQFSRRYYEDNKEEIAEKRIDYDKDYYEINRNKILENKSRKITCECGAIIGKGSLTRHKKSARHLQN